MAKYDYLVVGAGLFGSVFAQQMAEHGKRCLVIERRDCVGGNIHCEEIEGIQVHKYGPHIFHTSDQGVWDYVNRFARFNHYIHAPIAVKGDKIYNLPINMNTMNRLWGIRSPREAREILENQIHLLGITDPGNAEELALRQVGSDLYEALVKPYVEKQWGCGCKDLPTEAIRPLPVRFTFDNTCFPGEYQGIPTEGYDVMIKRMLAGCEVLLNTTYMAFGRANAGIADRIIYTGMIDEFFRFRLGALGYRTISYQTEVLDCPNYQGSAVVSYIDPEVPYTRCIEHKHFQFGDQPRTVITREYPIEWRSDLEPYFPTHDAQSEKLYQSYRALAVAHPDVIFAGRLGSYRYYNMDETVRAALDLAQAELHGRA